MLSKTLVVLLALGWALGSETELQASLDALERSLEDLDSDPPIQPISLPPGCQDVAVCMAGGADPSTMDTQLEEQPTLTWKTLTTDYSCCGLDGSSSYDPLKFPSAIQKCSGPTSCQMTGWDGCTTGGGTMVGLHVACWQRGTAGTDFFLGLIVGCKRHNKTTTHCMSPTGSGYLSIKSMWETADRPDYSTSDKMVASTGTIATVFS